MEVIKTKTDMSEDQQLDFYEKMFNALADKIRLKVLNQRFCCKVKKYS